jgi:hypothetical protein
LIGCLTYEEFTKKMFFFLNEQITVINHQFIEDKVSIPIAWLLGIRHQSINCPTTVLCCFIFNYILHDLWLSSNNIHITTFFNVAQGV